MTAAAISLILGGKKTLRRNIASDYDLRELTRAGLPISTLPLLASSLKVERSELARAVGVSERTLSRRLSGSSRLTAQESNRTVRVARMFALAVETLGDADKASGWMSEPNLALGGERPLDLLDTDTGTSSVETILGRIAYGIYS